MEIAGWDVDEVCVGAKLRRVGGRKRFERELAEGQRARIWMWAGWWGMKVPYRLALGELFYGTDTRPAFKLLHKSNPTRDGRAVERAVPSELCHQRNTEQASGAGRTGVESTGVFILCLPVLDVDGASRWSHVQTGEVVGLPACCRGSAGVFWALRWALPIQQAEL
ncbi:hypothetical protein B0H17DRAFT_1123492 [Mycena rosella]|uniref:Uncharacterized protein n=1 Tax=Mycena rosella TaxID=1033263 RepID=A0AAD7H2U4_MYCRO|nr:hypothetical protein B0H17DRAFT_1123492 [Mycena rosella]